MDFLNSLFESSQIPILSAFLLGLMTAISPCPLATNITAIGFISKDIEDKKRVFLNGILYTIGRAISYSAIGLLFYFGAEQFEISNALQEWGEKLLGPILIIIGIIMLDIIKLNFSLLDSFNNKMESKFNSSYLSALLLGVLFALAFCPYSGVLYFGMLIPMTISSASGLFLPFVFALGTGIPVIIFAWIIAYSIGSIGKLYENIKVFEKWFRKIVALVFIGVGIYYIYILFLK